MSTCFLLAAAEAGGGWADPLGPIPSLILAVVLLIVALLVLLLEFFVVSGGLLALIALVLSVAAVSLAFAAHPVAGWLFVVTAPVAAVLVAKWGLARLQRTRLVAQEVIGGNAGIAESSAQRGIEVGSVGEMMTKAMPSGRAHFPRGSADVTAKGGTLSAGDRVRVIGIAGPSIYVTLDTRNETTHPPSSPTDED